MRKDGFSAASGARANVVKIGIVVTDGNSNINKPITVDEAIKAKQDGVRWVCGLGWDVADNDTDADINVNDNIYNTNNNEIGANSSINEPNNKEHEYRINNNNNKLKITIIKRMLTNNNNNNFHLNNRLITISSGFYIDLIELNNIASFRSVWTILTFLLTRSTHSTQNVCCRLLVMVGLLLCFYYV